MMMMMMMVTMMMIIMTMKYDSDIDNDNDNDNDNNNDNDSVIYNDDRFLKIQFPFFWSLKIILSTVKIFLKPYLLVFLYRKKLKSTFSDLLLKTPNKSGRFSAKAFLARGTAMERHACSYTVWKDVSLKFISANKSLPRAILFHDIYVREFFSGISVISVEFIQLRRSDQFKGKINWTQTQSKKIPC